MKQTGTFTATRETEDAVAQAAAWYRENRATAARPLIPALRRHFGLTAHQAVRALSIANRGRG